MGDPLAKKDAWEQVQAKDRSKKEPGGKNLLMLYRNSKEISQKELDKLCVAYNANMWQMSPGIFEA